MQRSILLKTALFTIALVFCAHFGRLGEAGGSADKNIFDSNSQTFRILDSIPQSDAGISNMISVSDDTDFGVLIESKYPVDLADYDSIRFEIDDGIHYVYERDLSSNNLRVVEVAGDEPRENLIWAVYNRSLETRLPPLYFPDSVVRITVHLLDIHQNIVSERQFRFKIEPDPAHAAEFDRLPEYDYVDSEELLYEIHYDSGMAILSGELQGAKIFFDSDEPLTPGFGSSDDVVALSIDGEAGIGEPLSLVPHIVFHNPVKLLIPFPEGTDLGDTDIFYHNGVEWLRACDADGNVLPGGIGWMVAGSRVNHYGTSPPLVELQVYHFSSVQGFVAFRASNTTTASSGSRTHTGSGGFAAFECFIDAAGYEVGGAEILKTLALLWVLISLGVVLLVRAYRHTKKNGCYFKQQIF